MDEEKQFFLQEILTLTCHNQKDYADILKRVQQGGGRRVKNWVLDFLSH